MRYTAIALALGGLWAANANIHPKALRLIVDEGNYTPAQTEPGHIARTTSLPPALITDSARNQFTILYPSPEPVAVKWVNGNEYVAFVHRMWDPASTGYLKMHWTYDGMAGSPTWDYYEKFDVDAGLYQAGSRYPCAHWSPNAVPEWPIATFPGLVSGPAWGYLCAATVDKANGAYGVAGDNTGVSSAEGRVLQDGKVIVGANDGTPDIWLAVYDPVNGLWASNPQIYITGHILNSIMFDRYSNTIYLGTLNYTSVEFEYFTATWDGTNLNVNPSGTVVDIPADPGATYIWRGDWTLNYPDGGTTPRPSVQVAASAASDAEFAKYIYYGDGVNQVILPTVYSYSDTLQNILPESHQIASEPNTGHLVSMWSQVNEWRTDQTYGWANYDIYYSVSTDNGATWSTPVNLSEENPKKAHFCPKIPEHYWNGRIWLAYGLEIHDNTDAWWDVETGQDPPLHGMPFYLYLTVLSNIGVSENSHPAQTFSYRMVGKNLVLSGLPTNVKANATVYDVVGREMKSAEGTGSIRIDMSGLSAGTYLFKVDAGKFTTTGKVVVTR